MAKKKRRSTRKVDSLYRGKRYNPLGTKRDGERNARIRDLKNRVHELEQEIEVLKLRDNNAHNRETEYLRQIASFTPSKPQREALDVICELGVSDAVTLGIHEAVIELCKWRTEMTPRAFATVKNGAIQVMALDKVDYPVTYGKVL